MLLRELGAAIGRDIGSLSRWENGDRTPKPEQVAQILTALGVIGNQYDEIMSLAYRTDESHWVSTSLPELRQQMIAYVDCEQNATTIVEVAPLLVPGILQISDYIRAIMSAGEVPVSEVASRVAARLGRADVLTKSKPAQLTVLLGQGALKQDIGGKEVMARQIRHLLKMAKRPNIDLRVVPEYRGWHPGLEGEFSIIESGSLTTVFVGTRKSILILHEEGDVDTYKRAVNRIANVALDLEASFAFIADLAARMEKSR
jgi:transcriptional regulator with XRE-family HTH domain